MNYSESDPTIPWDPGSYKDLPRISVPLVQHPPPGPHSVMVYQGTHPVNLGNQSRLNGDQTTGQSEQNEYRKNLWNSFNAKSTFILALEMSTGRKPSSVSDDTG